MRGRKVQTHVLEQPEALRVQGGRRNPVLVVVQGNEIGRCYVLRERRMVVGRDPEHADVVLMDPSVSSKHALLRVDAERQSYEISDLGSRNGTWVNGQPVQSGGLREGDKIFVGSTVLKFTLHDSIEDRFHGELDRLMHVDSLTGLYVRRFFDQEYPRAFARARAEQRAFCVAMLDMDGLKAVNDQHGHQLGSHCVAEAGRLILEQLPAGALGARFGGDEFAVFFEDRPLDAACEVAERIRLRIDAFEFRRGDVVVDPTISIGVAELRADRDSADELLHRADEALYRAKRQGRNAVCR